MSALVDQIAELREKRCRSHIDFFRCRGQRERRAERGRLAQNGQRGPAATVFRSGAGQAHQPLLRTVPRAPLAGGAGADDEREFQYAPSLPEPTELYDGDVGKRVIPIVNENDTVSVTG